MRKSKLYIRNIENYKSNEYKLVIKVKKYTMIISAEDYPLIEKHTLGFQNNYVYIIINNNKIKLHNYLLNPTNGYIIDHKNHNTLDNSRENLRTATIIENNYNRRPIGGTSRFKGVRLIDGMFYAEIHLKSRTYFLGKYQTEIEAMYVYDVTASKLFKEFAFINSNPLEKESQVKYKDIENDKKWRHKIATILCKSKHDKPQKSKYTNVFYKGSKNKPWGSRISINGTIKYLRTFKTQEEAYMKYQQKKKRIL